MAKYNLHGRKFVSTGNEKGLSNEDTIFHYFQDGQVITGKYKGGAIAEGFLVGKQTADDELELLFHCITTGNELRAGQSKGKITAATNGQLYLSFNWNWLNGDNSGGLSFYKEVEQV
ncbi:hypothetical protein H8S84_07505 [Pontibacter sp. SD6]|uniref:N-acetylglutamate synthase n=2 Tax=Pontibacter cellulosilyticus TaxID=1720253 RepID=A0A923N5N3_9BACT|nr:hypothetical protein [Pontibacter cellulosilyticus]